MSDELLVLSAPWGERQVEYFRDRLEIDVAVLDADGRDAMLARADLLAGAIRHALMLDRATLAQLGRCRFVQVAGVGVDHVDLDAADALGLPIANSGDTNAAAVAEWTLMAILTVLQSAHLRHERLRRGRWEPAAATELGGKVVGIVGVGRIGRRVGDLVSGFGAAVVAHDVATAQPTPWPVVPLPELLATADVLTLHCPLLASTHHLIDAAALAGMKPGAVLINAARGGIVDETALQAALESGHLGGAALDVFEQEPVDATHPLLACPTVLLSPHAAASTRETGRRTREFAIANLARALRNEAPESVVTRTTTPRHLPVGR